MRADLARQRPRPVRADHGTCTIIHITRQETLVSNGTLRVRDMPRQWWHLDDRHYPTVLKVQNDCMETGNLDVGLDDLVTACCVKFYRQHCSAPSLEQSQHNHGETREGSLESTITHASNRICNVIAAIISTTSASSSSPCQKFASLAPASSLDGLQVSHP